MFAPQLSRKVSEWGQGICRFVRSCISQGHREDFYELKDQRFLGTEEFIEDILRDLNERTSFVYDIAVG